MISNHFSDDRRVGKILYAERVSSRPAGGEARSGAHPLFFKDANGILKKNHVLIPIVSHLPLR